MANFPQLDDLKGVWKLDKVNNAIMGGYWRVAGSRALWAGGNPGVSEHNTIDYVTITSTGDATDFGDATASTEMAGCFGSFTRAFFLIGASPSNAIDYVSIMTTGNAADFGDATAGTYFRGGCSNSTRGLFFWRRGFSRFKYNRLYYNGSHR